MLEKLDKIERNARKLEEMRKSRISEIDDILDLFQGKLGLDDILNQDYSLITDLANVRNEKNDERLAKQKSSAPPKTLVDRVASSDKADTT